MTTSGVSRQVRFRVPASDEVVLDWLEAQDNVSFSLRNMIRSFALTYGIQDATCLPLDASPVVMPAPVRAAQVASQGAEAPAKRASEPVKKAPAKPTRNHIEQVSQDTPVESAPVEQAPIQQVSASVTAPAPTPAPASDEAVRIADINSLLDD